MDGDYYKGSSQNVQKRLEQHNNGESSFTKNKCPWVLVYIHPFELKADALKEEKD